MATLPQLGDSILIRSPNWLGDAVMTLPAIHQLIQKKPDSTKVSILAPKKLHEAWKLVRGIDEVVDVDKSLLKTSSKLKKHLFSSAIIFPNSLRTGLEAVLAGIPTRIGFRGHARSLFLTKIAERKIPREGIRHQSLDYLDLMKETGLPVEYDLTLPAISTPPRPAGEGMYAVLCPGAEYGPAKRWPAERFAEVGDWIAQKYDCKVLILGASTDREIASQVSASMKEPSENLAGKTSLHEFIQYLAHAKISICNDSGSMHLAALLRTPTIAIFGSTEQRLTGPLGDLVSVVREHAPCSPCFLRECPIDFRCMTSIDPERIISEVESALKS